MIEHSSKSKGYLPMKSGPNMIGFDMGKSGSLMEMMQVGGQPSRGAAMLAQATQRQSDIKKLEDQQRAEAKRQKRGGLFGSIGGLAGGLLGAALAPVTGGASLALASGLGTALGRRVGEGIGAGKTVQADTEGTVFAQQDFRDVEQASRDYTRGMGERAIVSGLKAGLTAGFSPGGGIYGKVGGKLNEPLMAGIGKAKNFLSSISNYSALGRQGVSNVLEMAQNPTSSYVDVGPISVYGDDSFGSEYYQDGGLVEYQYGGGVSDIQSILQDAGITASPEQLALFEQFDSSSLNELASGLQSSLLSGTQQAQQQQAGMGFAGSGAVQQQQAQQRESAMDQFESAQERAAKQFESQTLGEAASMIGQGAEFSDFTAPPPTVSSLPTSDQGAVTFNGVGYVWDNDSGQYITQDEFEQGMSEYYDDLYD